MLHYDKTLDENKEDAKWQAGNWQVPILHTEVIHKKDYVFILAKTWGAAKSFYDKTELRQIDRINHVKQIKFLKDESQITKEMNNRNTVVILLSRYDEDENNFNLVQTCIKKSFAFLKYEAV